MRGFWIALAGGALFGAGVCAGAFLFEFGPVPAESTAPRGAAQGSDVRRGTAQAPEGSRTLDDLCREVARLSAEIASLRQEQGRGRDVDFQVRSAQTANRASASEEEEDIFDRVSQGRGHKHKFDFDKMMLDKKLEAAGVPEEKRDEIFAQLEQERAAIAERFRSEVDRAQWQDYVDRKSRGHHRLTDEDHKRMREMDRVFKAIQERVLAQNAHVYGGLSDEQRAKVESSRGGELGVGPHGEPTVNPGFPGRGVGSFFH